MNDKAAVAQINIAVWCFTPISNSEDCNRILSGLRPDNAIPHERRPGILCQIVEKLPREVNSDSHVPPVPLGVTTGAGSGAEMFQGLTVSQMRQETNGRSSGGTNPGASAGSAADVFSDFPAPPKSTATNGSSTSPVSGRSTDPFASSGLGDVFSSLGSRESRSTTSSVGASGGNVGIGNASVSGMRGGYGQKLGGNAKSGWITPPPSSAVGRPPSQATGNPTNDPFAGFFGAAVSGGSGSAGSTQMTAPVPSTTPPLGGFTPMPSGGGGVGSLEDQLVNTQREIAQLTRELGGSGMIGGGGSTSGTLGGMGSGGWGTHAGAMPQRSGMGTLGTQPLPVGGGFGQAPPQQGQVSTQEDPFSFLADGQAGPQQGSGSQFDFLR